MNIVIVSGHHPTDIPYTQITRKLFAAYAERHGYGFYYDDSVPTETETHQLHYRRCLSILAAAKLFPTARWFMWADSDVLVVKPDVRIEDCIDLRDPHIMYHLFHECNWPFPINTGVKFVSAGALGYEAEIHTLRNTPPWDQFPWEQKAMAEYMMPRLGKSCIVHDPYVLNNIAYQARTSHMGHADAVFLHLCGRTHEQRNKIATIFDTEGRIMDLSEDPTIQIM